MRSLFVCLVVLAASVSGIAATTVLENFNSVAIENLISQGSLVSGGVCQMGISSVTTVRVGIYLQESAISFGELLSGEAKIMKDDSSLADPYLFFGVDINGDRKFNLDTDYYFMQINPVFTEPDNNGWSKITFDLNSTFSKSTSGNTRPMTGKLLSEWMDLYGDCQVLRYLVGYNLQVSNTGRCYADDLQFKYGTPDPEPDPEEPVPAAVPVPGAVVLTSLGLGVVRYMRGRGRI
ncbi:MAG: hypothetical protein ABFD91_06625 [Anaerohalosphaeraceae bacterium]